MENQENLINDLLQLFDQLKLDDRLPDDFIKFASNKINTIKETVNKSIDKLNKLKNQINQLSNEELLDELINLEKMSIKLEFDKNELKELANQFKRLIENSKSNNKSINYLTEIKYEFLNGYENPYQKSFDQALLELNLDQQFSFDYLKNDFRTDDKLNQFTDYSKLSFNLFENNYSVYTLTSYDNQKEDKSLSQEFDLIKSLIELNLIKKNDEFIENDDRKCDSNVSDSDCSDNSNISDSDDSSNDNSDNSPIVFDKRFKIDEFGNLNETILNSSSDDSSIDTLNSTLNDNYTSDDTSNVNLNYNYSNNFLRIYDSATDETSSDEEKINTTVLSNLMKISLLQDHLSSSDNSDKE